MSCLSYQVRTNRIAHFIPRFGNALHRTTQPDDGGAGSDEEAAYQAVEEAKWSVDDTCDQRADVCWR